MTPWNAVLSLVLGAGGLVVDSASPDALCPPLETTRKTVAARLGHVELEGTWRASYVVVHRAAGEYVALTLVDDRGAVRLERELPVRGGSCDTLAQVMALVLERFFQRPEGGGLPEDETPLPARAPAAGSESAAPGRPSEPATQPALAAMPAAEPEVRKESVPAELAASPARAEPAWSLDAALWATNAWLAPSLRLTRTVAGPYRAGVSAAYDLEDHEGVVAEGSVSVRRVPVSLSVAREVLRGSWARAHVGVELLALFERARTLGLAATGDGLRVVPGLGIRVGADFLSASPVGPFAEVTAATLFSAGAPAFEVEHREVQRPPGLVVGLALGLRAPL